jgi:hypothetical protein
VLRLEPFVDDRHLRPGVLDGSSGRKPSDDREIAAASIRRGFDSEGERRPQLRAEWEVETLGRNPHDLELSAVNLNRAADDGGVAREATLPQAVSEDDAAMLSLRLFPWQERSPERGLHPNRRKKIR